MRDLCVFCGLGQKYYKMLPLHKTNPEKCIILTKKSALCMDDTSQGTWPISDRDLSDIGQVPRLGWHAKVRRRPAGVI